MTIGDALLVGGCTITTTEFINSSHKLSKSIIAKDDVTFYDGYIRFDFVLNELSVWVDPVDILNGGRITIKKIDRCKKYLSDWILKLYKLGVINKTQAEKLFDGYDVKIDYKDVYKKECYDNSDTELDY